MLSAEPALNHSTCSSLKVWRGLEVDRRAVGLDDLAAHVAARVPVGRPSTLMRSSSSIWSYVAGVGERERQQPLLLEVGLVDAGEAAGEDHHAAAEPRLHRGVLARRALAVVAVADRHPADARLVVVLGDLGIRPGVAVE